jgi:hypothetical protein
MKKKNLELEYVNSPTENVIVFIVFFIILVLIIYIVYKLRNTIRDRFKSMNLELFTTKNIPKKIYMCYKNITDLEKYSKNWKKLNPDYKIELYDDERCKDFLLKEYSQLHVDIFDYIKDGPIKSDFWRVCIINKYGGLYIDADIEPLLPLNEYIDDDDDFVTCISMFFNSNKKIWQLNPHFILTHKNNKILQNCIDEYVRMYKNNVTYSYWRWSICKIMYIDKLKLKKSHILYDNNAKYKFILELNKNDCEYNGKLVFHNRYNNYKNHNFV